MSASKALHFLRTHTRLHAHPPIAPCRCGEQKYRSTMSFLCVKRALSHSFIHSVTHSFMPTLVLDVPLSVFSTSLSHMLWLSFIFLIFILFLFCVLFACLPRMHSLPHCWRKLPDFFCDASLKIAYFYLK